VVQECARVHEAVAALRAGELARFGALLLESHASLRDDLDVSTPELDAIVSDAMRGGALGARMTGGGFGGSAIVARRTDARG
jgi:galactokinase